MTPVRFMNMRDYERDRNRILPTDARWDAAPIERVERVSPVVEIPLPNPPRFVLVNDKLVRMEAPAENTPGNPRYT